MAKFQKNITKRGLVPETTSKKGYDYPVGPIVLGFFVFVIIGSSLNEALKKEDERLKIAAGEVMTHAGEKLKKSAKKGQGFCVYIVL
ncbi:hypothetical protein ACJW30_04G023700 [Castanea mollissima]